MNSLPRPAQTVLEARQAAASALSDISATAALDAEILVCEALDVDRLALALAPERRCGREQLERLDELVRRRRSGEPIAYITSEKEFWSLPLRVRRGALVPRPETELLVERIVARLAGQASPAIADLGTGSGAVALAVATELPRARVIGTDVSAAALRVAEANRRALNVQRVRFVASDWLEAIGERSFDAIGSNPPYIPDGDDCLQGLELSHEPRIALAGGRDGLDSLRAIIASAGRCLKRPGWLFLEHGWNQGGAVRALLRRSGYENIATGRDLSGKERVTEGCLRA